jgi:HAD superfamily hydrolase (TIGR01509 family)
MYSYLQISAVVFDMDGLMFDTERVAQTTWQQAAVEYGYIFPEQTYRGVIGRTLPDVRAFIYKVFGDDFPFDQVYHRKQELLGIYITNHGIPVKPGLIELLEKIESLRLLKAVASSSGKQIIMRNLSAARIDAGRFQAIVGGDEIVRGKPAPDIFLAAAIALGLPASRCLVLEDSNAGIQAAHAAGSIPVMIPDMIPPREETASLAYRILPDLHAANRELFSTNGN